MQLRLQDSQQPDAITCGAAREAGPLIDASHKQQIEHNPGQTAPLPDVPAPVSEFLGGRARVPQVQGERGMAIRLTPVPITSAIAARMRALAVQRCNQLMTVKGQALTNKQLSGSRPARKLGRTLPKRTTNDRAGWQERRTLYLARAQEAQGAGDRVEAEYLYQHAEHYLRLLQGNAG